MVCNTYQYGENPDTAIIALHGWTGDESSLKPVAVGVRSKKVKWFFPRGPNKIDGRSGYSWYFPSTSKIKHNNKTYNLIKKLYAQIVQEGFHKEKTYLLGFSQGAALAMESGYKWLDSLAGVISIAGFIKYPKNFISDIIPAARQTPLYLFHGEKDNIVPVESSRSVYAQFHSEGLIAHVNIYNAKHKIPISSIKSIKEILEQENQIR